MSKWPNTPLIATLNAMLMEREKREKAEKEEQNEQSEGVALESPFIKKIIEALNCIPQPDSPCTCDAAVICSNATEESVPVHIKTDSGTVHLAGLYELNKTDIRLEKNFDGCKAAESGLCKIAENYLDWIQDNEWKDVDEMSGQGEGKETLSLENSFMMCARYNGVIYFHDDGQAVIPFMTGEQMYYLSDEYIEWIKMAEGLTLYPYKDEEDAGSAQEIMNVTLGIGFTFDITGRNWDVLHEVLGWTEAEINEIIQGVYAGVDYSDSRFTITEDQAYEMFMIIVERQYIPDVNNCIAAFNRQQNKITSYSQRELEAMFDYSYNNGLSPVAQEDGYYSPSVNDKDTVFYYYLRKDLSGAVSAVKKYGTDQRRRLNQMNLFFFDYEFVDQQGEKLDPLREKLGFFMD